MDTLTLTFLILIGIGLAGIVYMLWKDRKRK